MNDFFQTLATVADEVEMVANLILIYTAYRWAVSFKWITLVFTDGDVAMNIRVRKRDLTVDNLLDIMSYEFYEGGKVPPHVKRQVLGLVNPPSEAWKN